MSTSSTTSLTKGNTGKIIGAVIGLAVLFGTVYIVSKAWKKGQQ